MLEKATGRSGYNKIRPRRGLHQDQKGEPTGGGGQQDRAFFNWLLVLALSVAALAVHLLPFYPM
jgi:hypothetical protein